MMVFANDDDTSDILRKLFESSNYRAPREFQRHVYVGIHR